MVGALRPQTDTCAVIEPETPALGLSSGIFRSNLRRRIPSSPAQTTRKIGYLYRHGLWSFPANSLVLETMPETSMRRLPTQPINLQCFGSASNCFDLVRGARFSVRRALTGAKAPGLVHHCLQSRSNTPVLRLSSPFTDPDDARQGVRRGCCCHGVSGLRRLAGRCAPLLAASSARSGRFR